MLAKSLRSHSLYNYARYILSYIKIVYKPRNIPVQMKDECRLLIKTVVFIEHSVKEIPVHGLYNTWKTFSLVYGPSTVNPVCYDAAFESCGLSSYVRRADRHSPGEPAIKPSVGYPVGSFTKNWFSCEQNQPFKEDVCCCLSWLSVIVSALVQNKLLFLDPPVSCRTLC